MRRYDDPYNDLGPSSPHQSCPDCIIATQGYDFREGQVITAENDPLRDEGEAYSAKLRAAGVPVTAVRYQGIIHDFVMVNSLRDTHAAKAATAQGGEFLRAALHD